MNRDWTTLIVQGLERGGKYSPKSWRKILSLRKFVARLNFIRPLVAFKQSKQMHCWTCVHIQAQNKDVCSSGMKSDQRINTAERVQLREESSRLFSGRLMLKA